jgi:arylsulfatase A-like enzyme
MNPTSPPANRPLLLRLLPIVIIAALPLGVAVKHTPFRHSTMEVAQLALLYLLLASAMHLGALFAGRLHRLLGLLASLVIAAFLVMQLRLDAEMLVSLPVAGASVVILTAIHFLFCHVTDRPDPERRRPWPWLAATLVTLLLFGAAVGQGWKGMGAIRWRLLHDHRALGYPAVLFLSRSIDAEREDLWQRQGRLVTARENANEVVAVRPEGGGGSPHIVLILIDTLRADMLAAWGGDPEVMPRTNEFITRSVAFTDLQANASWTRASCASLLTGMLPEEHGAVDFQDKLAEEWHTMPELLGDVGYQTAAFVANWVQVGVTTGFAQGFEVFQELQSMEEFEKLQAERGEESIRELYARAEMVNRATLDWLRGEERDEAKPAFLYLHYLDPHRPYLAGEEPGVTGGVAEIMFGHYRQEARYLDEHLGVLFGALRRGLDGPLVIVFTSDHGEEFYEHGESGHGNSLYREEIWVPSFVYVSEGEPSAVLDVRLESRDLFDLVMEMARPETLDVVAWAKGRARETRYASQFLLRNVRGARPDQLHTALRLVDSPDGVLIWSGYGPSWELYDLAEDPGQLRNRIDIDAEGAESLRAVIDEQVRFWADRPRVERSEEDLQFLRDLGYIGGSE